MNAADLRNRANEDCQDLESRRRPDQTGAALTRDRMHSRREAALKTQGIKKLFLRDAKNCLGGIVRNYAVRSARVPCGKPIKAESWELILAGSAMRIKLRDDSRLRNDLPVAFRQRLIDQHSLTARSSTISS